MFQNEQTIKFWEDYHKSNASKEWILQPSTDLLEFLRLQFPRSSPSPDLKLLEIGSGTSTLARDIWRYVITINKNDGQKKRQTTVQMTVTDVSAACIQINKERDASLLDKNEFNNGNTLNYRTLDAINPPKEDLDSFSCNYHVVLDKGCLDTFLFRSRNRGGINKSYSTMLQTLLDNIWSWLKDDGVYLIISPRAKLKAVRDYAGFRSVQRHALPATIAKGDLVNQEKNASSPGYVYVCNKNTEYKIGGRIPAFAGVTNDQDLPNDNAECPKCGIIFAEFRNSAIFKGRKTTFLIRQWKGHCQHCKPSF